MSQKPVVRRRRASDDIEAAIDFCLAEAGIEIASSFVSQLEEAIKRIAKQPAAGSERYGHELQIHNLRKWPIKRFPFFIFYIEKKDRIEVVRVLHKNMDMPTRLDDQ